MTVPSASTSHTGVARREAKLRARIRTRCRCSTCSAMVRQGSRWTAGPRSTLDDEVGARQGLVAIVRQQIRGVLPGRERPRAVRVLAERCRALDGRARIGPEQVVRDVGVAATLVDAD